MVPRNSRDSSRYASRPNASCCRACGAISSRSTAASSRVGVGGRGGVPLQVRRAASALSGAASATMSTNSCWIWPACSMPRGDLPGGGRMPGRHRGAQRIGVPRDPLGHLRHPPADQRPILVGVGGHQIEHVAHRLQRRGDHVQLADIQSGVVHFDLHDRVVRASPRSSPGRRRRRAGSVEFPQCRIGPRRRGPPPRRGSSR